MAMKEIVSREFGRKCDVKWEKPAKEKFAIMFMRSIVIYFACRLSALHNL